MIKPISFGSTYRTYVTNLNNENAINSNGELKQFCDENCIPYKQTYVDTKGSSSDFSPYKKTKPSRYIETIDDFATAQCTIVASDNYDADIEEICANKGIKFEKFNTQEVLGLKSILRRINPAPKGYLLAYIDSKKLEKLLQAQTDNNFNHCEKDYNDYFKDSTDFALKSGDGIDVQTLSINYKGDDSTPESLEKYVNCYGIDNLNSDSLSIGQEQRGNNTDINTYYSLKDMGFNAIPMYLDDASFKNAQTLGLIKFY